MTDTQKSKIVTLEGLDTYNGQLKQNVLDDLVASVQHDSTNKKLTYTTLGGSTVNIANDSAIASAVTVSNNAPTLAWNSTSTVGTVNGVDLTVKLPANPNVNTNTAKLQVSDTTNRKINTAESTSNYIQFTGGTNKITVTDGTKSFDVTVTPSIANNVTGSSLTADQIVLGNGSSAVKASGKTVETSLTSTSDTAIPTSKAVASYVSAQMTSVLKYKGTIGTSGTVTALPATHAVGDVYVVATAGTYAGKACEVGDYIICKTAGTSADDAHWDVVNGENQVENKSASLAAAGSSATIATVDGTNITVTTPSSWTGLAKTGTVTSVTPGNGLINGTSGTSKTAITGTGTISLQASGATAGSYGPSAAVSGTDGTTVNIPYITVDTYGRVTSISNKVYTSKNTTYEMATASDIQSIFE